MKTLFKISLLLAVIVILYSCTDIKDFGNNIDKITVMPPISRDDSLSFVDLPPIDFGSIKLMRVDTIFVIIKDLSKDYAITIYDIKLMNNFEFKLYPEHGYPVVIPPLMDNSDNRLVAIFNTSIITTGFYQDTILFNGSQKYKFVIQGNVY
jgi:hypothetical protein